MFNIHIQNQNQWLLTKSNTHPTLVTNVPYHFLFLIQYTEKIHTQKKSIGSDKDDLDAANVSAPQHGWIQMKQVTYCIIGSALYASFK